VLASLAARFARRSPPALPPLQDKDLLRSVAAELDSGTAYKSGRWGISLGHAQKKKLLKVLRKDVEFLQANNIIDYSLLVGVRGREPPVAVEARGERGLADEEEEASEKAAGSPRLRAVMALLRRPPAFLWRETKHLLRLLLLPGDGVDSSAVECRMGKLRGRRFNEPAIFYLGLIDPLQPWSGRKWLERKAKGLVTDVSRISAAPPAYYAQRFLAFLDSNIT
jgi:hypothetical protein